MFHDEQPTASLHSLIYCESNNPDNEVILSIAHSFNEVIHNVRTGENEMTSYRRLGIAVVVGALLGVLCIIGVGARIPGQYSNVIYLTAVWYNRVIMGLMVGFAGHVTIIKSEKEINYVNAIVRGLIIGLIVSSATLLLSDTLPLDWLGWFMGLVYGPIIDVIATATDK